MCGIFGIVTSEEQALGKIMIEAGYRLSYRGYDSVGCAVIDQGGFIDLRKDVGKIDEVAARLKFAELVGNRGILQLRWATFGTPSQENAQPHLDSGGKMVGAHNGNVVNNLELRQQFIAEGMIVRSQNDGESCVHAVERYINRNQTPIDAIQHAYRDLKGDYAFVIGKVDEDCIHAIKKGSGLVVGVGEGFTVISSDLPSLLPLTRQIIRINDGEIVSLWADRIELRSVVDGSLIQRNAETVSESMEAVQKGGYAHFMLKEIYEQPVVAGELIHMSMPRRISRRSSPKCQVPAICSWLAAAPAITPACSARSICPAWQVASPSRSWRRNLSHSMVIRFIRMMWVFSSARVERPKMFSTRSRLLPQKR